MQHAPYREVPIHGKGGLVVAWIKVDEADYEWAMDRRWNLVCGYRGRYYPGHGVRENGKYVTTITLHRELLGLVKGDGKRVDHINGDPLDNRRVNLEITTHRENMRRIHTNTDVLPAMRHRVRNLEARLAVARAALEELERKHARVT